MLHYPVEVAFVTTLNSKGVASNHTGNASKDKRQHIVKRPIEKALNEFTKNQHLFRSTVSQSFERMESAVGFASLYWQVVCTWTNATNTVIMWITIWHF